MKEEDDDKDIVYIQPNAEVELPKDKRQACREIVAEIKNFGVSQRQILFLIQLLAMELENGDAMRSIVKTVGDFRSKISLTKLTLPDQQKIPKTLLKP